MCIFCLHSFTISRNLLIFRKFRVKANRFFAFTRSPIPYSLSGIGTWGRTEFTFTNRLLIISALNRKVKAVKEKQTNYNSVRACARGKIRRKSDACRGGKPAATSRVAAKTTSEINLPPTPKAEIPPAAVRETRRWRGHGCPFPPRKRTEKTTAEAWEK